MRRFTFPVSFWLSVCLVAGGGVAGARAEDKKDRPKSERVHFETVDQVELNGTFWPSTKGRKAPCVILLHKLGKGSHEEGWDLLGDELAKKGFAVLSFDFRGHGDSNKIGAGFWKYPFNRDLVKYKGTSGGKPPEVLNLGDFKPAYWPFLVNDITAARTFLERKNDSGECNISNLILIGAEDGATLGVLWLASESRRYRLLPGDRPDLPPRLNPPKLNAKPEAKDVIGCVWLSMSTSIGRTSVAGVLPGWLQDVGKEDAADPRAPRRKVPMAFLYGKEDGDSARLAKGWVRLLKTPGKSEDIFERAIEGGGKVRGSPLLKVKEDEGTVAQVVAEGYLAKVVEHGNNEWEKRETERHPFVWAFPRQRIQAKNFEEKAFQPIPLNWFGLR